MKTNQPVRTVPVEFRLQNVTLTDERRQYFKENLGAIPQLVARFPTAEVHADLHKHPHKGDYHVKMTLKLNNETLFTGERDMDLTAAWRRCTSQLAANTKEFKEKLARKHTYSKVTDSKISEVYGDSRDERPEYEEDPAEIFNEKPEVMEETPS